MPPSFPWFPSVKAFAVRLAPGRIIRGKLQWPPNRVAAQLVSFLEERMRGPALHQANEENEEFCHAPARGQPNQWLAGARRSRDSKVARRRLAAPEVPNWLAGARPSDARNRRQRPSTNLWCNRRTMRRNDLSNASPSSGSRKREQPCLLGRCLPRRHPTLAGG